MTHWLLAWAFADFSLYHFLLRPEFIAIWSWLIRARSYLGHCTAPHLYFLGPLIIHWNSSIALFSLDTAIFVCLGFFSLECCPSITSWVYFWLANKLSFDYFLASGVGVKSMGYPTMRVLDSSASIPMPGQQPAFRMSTPSPLSPVQVDSLVRQLQWERSPVWSNTTLPDLSYWDVNCRFF